MDIRLPVDFTDAHRAAVLRFVQGKPMDAARHIIQLEAFDRLHRAMAGDETFVAFYERIVEEPYADSLIGALFDAPDPSAAARALRRGINQQMPHTCAKLAVPIPTRPPSSTCWPIACTGGTRSP